MDYDKVNFFSWAFAVIFFAVLGWIFYLAWRNGTNPGQRPPGRRGYSGGGGGDGGWGPGWGPGNNPPPPNTESNVKLSQSTKESLHRNYIFRTHQKLAHSAQ